MAARAGLEHMLIDPGNRLCLERQIPAWWPGDQTQGAGKLQKPSTRCRCAMGATGVLTNHWCKSRQRSRFHPLNRCMHQAAEQIGACRGLAQQYVKVASRKPVSACALLSIHPVCQKEELHRRSRIKRYSSAPITQLICVSGHCFCNTRITGTTCVTSPRADRRRMQTDAGLGAEFLKLPPD
jgi:hypothetical protein